MLALSRAGPFWTLPVTIGGRALRGLLDTRSSAALSVSPQVAQTLEFAEEPRVIGRAGGAALPTTDLTAAHLAGEMAVGGYTFPRPFVVIHALPPGFPTDPVVGSGILRNFTVSLDQRHGRLGLARTEGRVITLDEPPERAPVVNGPGAEYVGTYGDRRITMEESGLYLQRNGGPKLKMIATGQDAFTLDGVPQAKIEFERDGSGKIVRLRVLTREGTWDQAIKS